MAELYDARDEAARGQDEQQLWQRSGTTIYLLRQAGWKRGKPVMENEFTISIQVARGASAGEAEILAASICSFLNIAEASNQQQATEVSR